MTFETLKDLHLYKIRIRLHSELEYEGIITSHTFEDNTFTCISEISLLGDKDIVKIKCEDIRGVEKLEKVV